MSDQCASRVALAARNVDIGCRCAFTSILEGCYSPKPHVETIQNVVSFKLAINPDGALNNRYPSSSLIRAAQNIKDTHYFIFYRDFDGTPVFRDKVDVDQKQWSLPMVPWKNGKSGLQPEQLRQKPTRPPHEPDLVKMSNTVTESLFRCNEQGLRH